VVYGTCFWDINAWAAILLENIFFFSCFVGKNLNFPCFFMFTVAFCAFVCCLLVEDIFQKPYFSGNYFTQDNKNSV
jgi:hypothetical protein